MKYETAVKQRHTNKYRKARLRYFKSVEWLCEHCKARDVIKVAEELDHIVPIHIDPDLFWDENNWQALCKDCHKKKSDAENKVRWGHDKAHQDDAFAAEIAKTIEEINNDDGRNGI